MSEAIVVRLMAEMLWLTLLLSLPTVVVAAAVGVVVSLVQALTQVQDQTVQFLIKLIAVSVTLVATYGWMGHVLMNYAGQTFEQIGRMR
ncbi:type III secretion system export apparatus subunit SctS [Pandoraea terrae]|nr:type III secretion system export apparatus subunit SctS [Pandoraea terrae]